MVKAGLSGCAHARLVALVEQRVKGLQDDCLASRVMRVVGHGDVRLRCHVCFQSVLDVCRVAPRVSSAGLQLQDRF
jgi:hypothetical protein